MSDKQFYMVIYLVVAILAGVGEYFHLVPMGTAAVVIGGILGHSFGVNINGGQKPPQEPT